MEINNESLSYEELLHSKAVANLIVDAIPEAVLVVDEAGRIKHANARTEEIFGYQAKALLDQPVEKIIPEHFRDHHEVLRQSFRGEGVRRRMGEGRDLLGLHRDGHVIPVEIGLAPVRFDDQDYVVASVIDISVRKAEEKKTLQDREQQAILRELLELSLGGGGQNETLTRILQRLLSLSWLNLLSKGGVFLREQTGERHLRLAASHNLSPHVQTLCAFVPMGHCLCGRAAASGEMQYASCVDGRHENAYLGMENHGHYSLPLISDGELMGVLFLYLPPNTRQDAFKEQFLASVADILAGYLSRKRTEQQLLEQQGNLESLVAERTADLEQARLEAERLSRVKDNFLATMSHEIRTPIHALLGILELVNMQGLGSKQTHMMDVAQESGRSLLRIIDDILDYSKIEAGKLTVVPEPASIAETLDLTARFFQRLASSKGVLLTHSVAPEISPAVMVDRLRLRQVLNNLLSNAIKFTDRGYVDVKAELVEHLAGRDRVRITVADTGIGIAPEHQEVLFRPFAQADDKTTRRYGGTGLGLAICHRVVEMMEGSLELKSTLGQGTTLTLTLDLPVIAPELLQEAKNKSRAHVLPFSTRIPPSFEAACAGGTLVLVVDDHPVNREVMIEQLAALGYASEQATSGVEALRKWESRKYGLLITDCHMPEMDGYQLTREIRRQENATGRQRTTVLGWTANALPNAMQECLAAGMDDMLVKPTDLGHLRNKLDTVFPLPVAPPGREPMATHSPRSHSEATLEEVLDRAVLRELTSGDADLENKILARFKATNQADAEALRQAFGNHDATEVGRLAHRMKGAARVIGARPFAQACEALEHAGKSGDWPEIEEAHDGCKAALGLLEQVLQNFSR